MTLDERLSLYEQLAKDKKKIEEKMDELKPEILEELQDDQTIARPDGGRFSVGYRANWKYSEELEEKLNEIEALQKEEQIEGVAINNATRFFTYNSPKK